MIGGKSMKRNILSKLSFFFGVILLTVFICCVQSLQAKDEWTLYYWGFENSLSDEANSLTSGTEGAFESGKQGQALNVAQNGAIKSEKLAVDVTKGFTMSAWIYLNHGAEGYNIIMSHGNTMVDSLDRFQIHIAQAGSEIGGGYVRAFAPAISAEAFPSEAADAEEYPKSFVPYDTWTHVAVTFNGEKAVLYVNGEKAEERTTSNTIEIEAVRYNTITIGALNHDAQQFSFNGLIDEAVYANYPMKSDEISLMASNPTSSAKKLAAWATGTETIIPDTMFSSPEKTPGEGTEKPNGGKNVFYWPLEEDAVDISHYEIDLDFNGFDYAEGVVGNGAEAFYGGNISEPLELDDDFTLNAFTVSMWVRVDRIDNGTNYAVLFAAGDKANEYHFEAYITMFPDAEYAYLAFYNTGAGGAMEGIVEIKVEELTHIAFTYDGERLCIYKNGESVFNGKKKLVIEDFGSNSDCIALGSLVDTTLPVVGMFDEVIFADSAFDSDLIKKLYSNPAEATVDIKSLVEANYPEGYTPPTPTPIPTEAPITPTPVPTEAATPNVKPSVSKVPSKVQPNDNTTTLLIVIILITVVVIAAAIGVLIFVKKKTSRK